ncbi:hypothetical protein [Jannaschia marina]|uniref:hypothetical protein n=1 Tax=Jannaschia marina TaxID=2741674 RepID=UPI0015CCD3A3|nr:hypothetical protein [Jannaschia marina]
MQLDRLMTKTVTRLAKAGIAGLRQTPATERPAKAPAGDLRGSGSWANEWAGARAAVARAKAMATPAKARKAKATPAQDAPADTIPEGTVRARPLMSTRDVKLHNWIADRLEAEAPCCSLHAGVALGSFLTADTAHESHDPLAGLAADMLIIDETGQPIAALIREDAADPSKQLLLIDALLDADVPIIDIQPRPSLAKLWDAIAEALPEG